MDERTSGFAEASALIGRYGGFALARHKAEAIIAEALAQLRIFDQGAVQEERAVLQALTSYVLNRKK